MGWPELDVSAWNLAVPLAVALSGCGPQSPAAGGVDGDGGGGGDGNGNTGSETGPGSDTGSESETGPGSETGPTPECEVDADCYYGYCENGQCYDEYCGQGGKPGPRCGPCYGYDSNGECCYDYDDCYEEPDPGCAAHDECSAGKHCNEYCVEAAQLPSCANAPDLAARIPLPEGAGGSVLSLTFADADDEPGEDLVLATTEGLEVIAGPGTAPPSTVDVGAEVPEQLTTVRLDADTRDDLLGVVGETRLLALFGDGSGGFVPGPATETTGVIEALVTGDFDGDGDTDALVLIADQPGLYLGDGTGALVSSTSPSFSGTDLAAGDLDGDASSDLVFHDTRTFTWLGAMGSAEELREHMSPVTRRSLTTGDFDGDGTTDVLGVSLVNGWALVSEWPRPSGGPAGNAVVWGSSTAFRAALTGDVDGDGIHDAVFAAWSASLGVRLGGAGVSPEQACFVVYATPHAPMHAAVGDFDADGKDDVAFAHGVNRTVFTHPP